MQAERDFKCQESFSRDSCNLCPSQPKAGGELSFNSAETEVTQ